MDFLGFTFSVWTAIFLGMFGLFLIAACAADRRYQEREKWLVVVLGLVGVMIWQWWQGHAWNHALGFLSWKGVGTYLAIGLAYAFVEFWFQIRREARTWKNKWVEAQVVYDPRNRHSHSLEEWFVATARHRGSHNTKLVDVQLNAQNQVEPVVNRFELAQGIACWTLLWPGYAASLLLGDFLREIFRRIADVFAALSKQFVKRAFSGAFTR